jgi:NitT/TauT family transport system permease protein
MLFVYVLFSLQQKHTYKSVLFVYPCPDVHNQHWGFLMAQQTVQFTSNPTNQREPQPTPSYSWLRWFTPLVSLLTFLTLWQIVVLLEIYPRFIIPAPLDVWTSFVTVLSDGTLLTHVGVTLREMLLGLGIGVLFGTVLGYLIAKNPILDEMLSPILVAFQATPVVAYAPLLIIWFGTGMMSKIITTAIIVFFPTLMNVVVGLRNVPQNLRELMRSLKATPTQTFLKLEVPAALPVMLAGLKTSATLAVIGAVVGEFVGASAGLGFLVISARSRFDTPLVLVTVFTMTALALSMYLLISLLERVLLRWQHRSH